MPLRPAPLAIACILLLAFSPAVIAGGPRVLPSDQLPGDARLGPPKTLNEYFPFHVPETAEAWHQRAEQVRRRILVANGLWPMPTATPLNSTIHGRVDRDEYSVEKVYFESFPGHYVTGNLYRPKGKNLPLPAVLSPHGHWHNGRFYDVGERRIREQLVAGEERFEVGGRSPLQSRCVQLARMGCVVFHYDMVGYGDSTQISHRPGSRDVMNTLEDWGYFSPQAELRLQNMMGLQTYNSIRALDFLASLPDVDPQRIAVTGASGGGTQTFILCAIDPRPKVAFPAVMVSTAMQGGCTCENACYLRIGTGNVEFAALFAPKPLAMTGADDWTREIATKGLPELERLYELLGAKDRVAATPLLQFGHNYNYVSRAVMYRWLNRHLNLGWDEPLVEEDYEPLSTGEMSVFNAEHPSPPAGAEHERALLRWQTEDSDRQMAELVPGDAEALERWREVVGGGFDVILGRGLSDAAELEFEANGEADRGDYVEYAGLLRQTRHGEELPVVFLHPKHWNKQVVVWIDEAGKAGLYDTGGAPHAAVAELLAAGISVAGVDLLYQGEFLAEGATLDGSRDFPRPSSGYAGYHFGYNHPLFSQRVHDVLTVVSFAATHEQRPEQIYLVGLNEAGPLVAAACAQAGDAVSGAALDTAGFRFAQVNELADPRFLPGAVKYGDLPTLMALAAPRPLWIAGEGDVLPAPVAEVYRAAASAAQRAAGAAEPLTLHEGDQEDKRHAVVRWLLKRSAR